MVVGASQFRSGVRDVGREGSRAVEHPKVKHATAAAAAASRTRTCRKA